MFYFSLEKEVARQDVVWVLGAPDAEMQAIENLLRECGQVVVYATSDAVLYGRQGKQRVHGGNAYAATSMSAYPPDTAEYIFVECDVPSMPSHIDRSRVDHHRPGDPGYGVGPERYLEASSIGQVISRLAHMGLIPKAWPRKSGPGASCPGDIVQIDGVMVVITDDYHDTDAGGWPVKVLVWAELPYTLALAAAADHCLAAAYQGLCPGVSVDELLRHRVEEKSKFQKRSAESVLADIELAKRALRDAPKLNIDGAVLADARNPVLVVAANMACNGMEEDTFYEFGTASGLCSDGWVETHRFAKSTIPELPEAACVAGIPFISEITEPTSRRKVVLQGVSVGSDLVQRFLSGEIVPGLADYYGDPARGFAGGYITQSGG